MARNSGGTHSLPAGNPVVTGTSISSTVQNNTLTDLSTEITDSLCRSGKGAMLAALELADGSAATPALSFDNDTDCGLYRIGTNNIAIAMNGAKVVDIGTASVAFPDGAVGTPGIGFKDDTDSGLYRIGANNIGVAVGGSKVVDVGTTVAVSVGLTVTQNGANTAGATVTGNGTGAGLAATSGSGATGNGVTASSAATDGHGVSATGAGAGNGVSASSPGGSSGAAVKGVSAGTGAGGEFTNSSTGVGLKATGNATRAPLNLVPQAGPSGPSDGDIWVETVSNTLKVRINGVTKTVTVT